MQIFLLNRQFTQIFKLFYLLTLMLFQNMIWALLEHKGVMLCSLFSPSLQWMGTGAVNVLNSVQ